MRGGLQRWKRGVQSHGVTAAISYALKGECDAAPRLARGVEALAEYSGVADLTVTRYAVDARGVAADQLSRDQLCAWVDGCDPITGERRGRELLSPQADLLLDGVINAPKSFSLVALVHPDLAREYEALQDRLRDRILTIWQCELNARRGHGGCLREDLARIEVVELQHRRSRALDPHIHRHLWLNVRVLGEDGKWSNLDSRVAMKIHTVINAEGDLAARTDPEWIAALARHGFTLNVDGEVAEVAHAVRPLSRRSNQIEANRAVLLERWRDAHGGLAPDRAALVDIDRLAWATGRPRKPTRLDEDEWTATIRDELAAIDPALLRDGGGIHQPTPIDDLDVAFLAEVALVDADRRSTATGGRFSLLDVRAGAMRAVAASGVVAERTDLQPLIDRVAAASTCQLEDLLGDEPARPPHIKAYMASATFRLKQDLGLLFDQLTAPGADLTARDIAKVAASMDRPPPLDTGQAGGAAAIAGTHRLVAVTGPAGSGKTSLLRVAKRALDLQRRRMIVVAPTKKAASVAGREIGVDSASLHALLADHGWRWGEDTAGSTIWWRMPVGSADERGCIYRGPSRFPLTPGDRIVVDEAGMVDLHAARALAAIAAETGAGVAMIGDHLQAMPVGHSGAMACMARRAGSVVELSAVHRFRDPEYGDLTLRMRDPGCRADAIAVAHALDARGSIHEVTDRRQARDVMVEAYFRTSACGQRVALITGTNEEADAINDAIQQRRIDAGQLSQRRIGVGAGEQRLLEGDVVQTRRNDRTAGVENRALWTVRRLMTDGAELVSLGDSSDRRVVSADYLAEHVQLAYASTVHGIQGETVDVSVVGPGVDAAGLYVGMTRGRLHNEAIAVSDWQRTAVNVIAEAMLRGRPELTIDDARAAARSELARAAQPSPPEDPRAAQERWLSSAHAAVREGTAAHAHHEATAHGRADPYERDPGPGDAAIEALLQRIHLVEQSGGRHPGAGEALGAAGAMAAPVYPPAGGHGLYR